MQVSRLQGSCAEQERQLLAAKSAQSEAAGEVALQRQHIRQLNADLQELEFRSLYVARKTWDWVQSPYGQDLCAELIVCVGVSQWLLCNACGQDILMRFITCCDCRLALLNM